MSTQTPPEPLDAAIEEYIAVFPSDWKSKTLTKYKAEFRDFPAWLEATGRPATTASLGFATLLAYVGYLKAKPVVRGVWRGDAVAVGRATSTSAVPRSLNSVNASMRCPRAFVLWLFEDGRLAASPFARQYRGGEQNPLRPRARRGTWLLPGPHPRRPRGRSPPVRRHGCGRDPVRRRRGGPRPGDRDARLGAWPLPREAIGGGAALCVDHLLGLAARRPASPAWPSIADHQLAPIEALRERLRSFADHSSHDRRHLVTEDERASAAEASELLGGTPGDG